MILEGSVEDIIFRVVILTTTYDNGRDIRFILQLRESWEKKENIVSFSSMFLFIYSASFKSK